MAKRLTEELLARISKEDLYQFYIEENHTVDETLEGLSIPNKDYLFKLLKIYELKKPRSLTQKHIEKTFIDKYGVATPLNTESGKEKSAATKLEKYGSSTYNNREKSKITCTERYGVDNLFKDTERIKESYRAKLGVDHPMQSAEVVKRYKDTMTDRYGAPTPYQVPEILEKAHAKSVETCVERYGAENPMLNPEVKGKWVSTHQEKYGVDYPCQLQQCSVKGNDSKPNKHFASLLEDANILYEREFALGHSRYDFKVGNTLIEIDPYATHNSTWGIYHCDPKSRTYHQGKTKLAEENGYRCIHIFDWDDIEKVVKLFYERKRVYGRKCEVKEITPYVASDFCQLHHLQNYAKSSINIGLYYEDELVSVMTFGKPRYNKNYEWELVRYCSSYNVVGGAEKLFSYFVKHYNPSSVISYCDRAKFTGDTYIKLGFKLKTWNIPSKHWYNPFVEKTHITDNLLRQRGYDQLFNANYGKGTSNEQLMIDEGYVEMYDCGQATYVWNN